jgi:putative ABC transport system permease protein
MRTSDLLRLAWQSVWFHRQRSSLTMLGILIGIASVILLTSIGEGTRRYVLSEFTQFGTTLVAVNPGRMETSGLPGALGNTVHPLTVQDAEALSRIPGVERIVPVVMGAAPVEYEGKTRDLFVYGVTAAAPQVWRMPVRTGRFLPELDPRRAAPVAVLGPKAKRELFGEGNCLGRHVRISGQRFLVTGIMEAKGQFLGFDIDDAVYIPVENARQMFNREALQEIDLLVANATLVDRVVERVKETLRARHNDEEDFTLTTQTGMLDTLDRILRMVSFAVAGLGAISLLVGAIGILTVMWISVNERTTEIGLARAVGATPRQVQAMFLTEATVLSTLGGMLGLGTGMGLAQLLQIQFPALPVHTPATFVVAALVVSLAVGLLSGLLPARRAAALDPIAALAEE